MKKLTISPIGIDPLCPNFPPYNPHFSHYIAKTSEPIMQFQNSFWFRIYLWGEHVAMV